MIRPLLARLLSPPDLTGPGLKVEVAILFDADMSWTVHVEKAELTEAERMALVRGMLDATNVVAQEQGIKIGPRVA